LKAFLNNSAPSSDQCVQRDELTAADHRIGIELDKDTLTSADGMLYAISLIATKPKHNGMPVCLYVEIKLPLEFTNLLDDILMPFGGEGKYVRVRRCPGSVFDDASAEPVRSGPTLWYLATPTFFAPNASPLPKTGGKLIAAASGSGVPVSGWDVARNGPRPTRFAIPAGAVYFVDGHANPNDFLNTGHETESQDLRQEGWGFALPGHWEGLK
jgi:CRISPR-associated protein Cmr3